MLIHQGNDASAFSGGESREKSAGKAVFLPLFARESSRKGQGKRPGLSGSALKLIAACSMLLDHMGVLWIKKGVLENETPAWLFALWGEEGREGFERAYLVLRCAGRLAFPIFAFFLAEGFCHSRNRKRYGLRLLAAALLTEGIFDWAIYGKWFYPAYQNVLFTLLIGFVMLWGIERSWQNEWARAFWIVAGGGGAFSRGLGFPAAGDADPHALLPERQPLSAGCGGGDDGGSGCGRLCHGVFCRPGLSPAGALQWGEGAAAWKILFLPVLPGAFAFAAPDEGIAQPYNWRQTGESGIV